MIFVFVFFFKQKTAYEMRISDWSSDVCSSDLADTPVASELVGAVWPAAHPGEDPLLYGHVELQPKGAFEARSVQTFRLVYTVGRYGIDDTGGIAVMFRFFGDQGDLQTSDPTGYNYVSAHTDTEIGRAHV